MLPILRPCSRGSLSNFGHSPGGHCYRRLAGREAVASGGAPPDFHETSNISMSDFAQLKGRTDFTVLGIESSCDETAAAVVYGGRRLLSNIIASQIDIHKRFGGVVPEIASRNHTLALPGIVDEAVRAAGLTLRDIDAIAVTYGAGLIGALLVGVSSAKALSYALDIPLVKVNHIEAHIAANYLEHDIEPPFVALVASGGHTSIVRVDGYNEHRLLAATTDDAIGEAFDKVARLMGLDYPGGASVDKLAAQGQPRIPLTKHKLIFSDGNVSYSGLKTAVVNYVHNARQKGEAIDIPDLCASFTVAAVDPLVEYAVASAVRAGADKLVLAGGVAANTYLRRRLSERGAAAGLTIVYPSVGLCTDNAAMVACRGWYSAYEGRNEAGLDLNAASVLRVGE